MLTASMHALHRTTYGDYHIGTHKPLTNDQARQLIALFETPTVPTDTALGGRTSVITCEVAGIGKLVIKHYRRGGFISKFNEKTYLGLGKPRCQVEFEMLNRARNTGVGAPEPIVFGYRGRLLYQCWLVTRMIHSHQTLVQLSRVDLPRSLALIDSVVDQIKCLIRAGIRHVDLHPGNIIVDTENKIYFVDFDKAGLTRMNAASLRDHYVKRWKRAVVKHRLAPDLWKRLEAAMGRSK